MKYIASCSCGKDSIAMVLTIIEKKFPLDYVIFFDTGKEFKSIYKNCYFFNAKAKKQPQIVNKYNEFASEKDLDDYCYSGATFCVSVNFYAFDKNGNRGVSAALNAVMLRKQTERIDGSVNAQAEFGEFAEKPAQGGDFGGLDDSEFSDDGEDIDF